MMRELCHNKYISAINQEGKKGFYSDYLHVTTIHTYLYMDGW